MLTELRPLEGTRAACHIPLLPDGVYHAASMPVTRLLVLYGVYKCLHGSPLKSHHQVQPFMKLCAN